jgi:hypothetical protein
VTLRRRQRPDGARYTSVDAVSHSGKAEHSDLGGSGPCSHGLSDSISGQGWQGDYYIKMISASVSALYTHGATLKGWPALGDVYCNVERRRSWTCFKLVHQRVNGSPGSATFSPDLGLVRTRLRPPGPLRRTRKGSPGSNRTPQGGVAAGVFTPRWTRASRRRISPWSPLLALPHGTGVRRRVHTTPTLGAPGARHPDDRTTGRAGGDWGGRPPPDHRSHPVGPGRLDLGPAPAQRDRPSETRGD